MYASTLTALFPGIETVS